MSDCIFCKIVKGEIPCNKVYEDDKILAFLDINPINKGHTLIIPKEHYESTLETPDELIKHIAVAVKRIAKAVLEATGAKGCNIGINNGEVSGQLIFHTHWHIMPRFPGDGHELWKGNDTAYAKGEVEKMAKNIKDKIYHAKGGSASG